MKAGKIILLSLLTALLVDVMPARADLAPDTMSRLFHQANQAFQQANEHMGTDQAADLYDRAALLYERIITEGGVQNAKLYYNLANAYLLNDNIGKAILNYRRAENLDHQDADIQKNLAFARAQRLDQVTVEPGRKVLQTLFFWHYDFSVRTRFILMCVGLGITCIIAAIMVYKQATSTLIVLCAVSVVLVLGLATSVAWELHTRSQTDFGVITAPQVTAYQGDGTNYPLSFKEPLHAGTEFKVLEIRAKWLHIMLTDGTDTWIPHDTCEII